MKWFASKIKLKGVSGKVFRFRELYYRHRAPPVRGLYLLVRSAGVEIGETVDLSAVEVWPLGVAQAFYLPVGRQTHCQDWADDLRAALYHQAA